LLGGAGNAGTAIGTPFGATKNILLTGGGVFGGLGPVEPFGGGEGAGFPFAMAFKLPCGNGGSSGNVRPKGPIVPGDILEKSEKPVEANSGMSD